MWSGGNVTDSGIECPPGPVGHVDETTTPCPIGHVHEVATVCGGQKNEMIGL